MTRKEDVALLERLRGAGPEKGLASVAGSWEGSDELARVLDRQRRTRPRTAAKHASPATVKVVP
ncbi:hypothetical protein FBQ97_10780 [Acidobacteria bacterium ACD]|nr:MAG: hypothetical protein EDX89_16510 [Acidobacteriota bacterium]MCE7957231.1 hypothetical protein [Acidobacteria bacterium ACB2]MDL1950283.1 hypothetical protein [Acidobacteria bacterium ACD]